MDTNDDGKSGAIVRLYNKTTGKTSAHLNTYAIDEDRDASHQFKDLFNRKDYGLRHYDESS